VKINFPLPKINIFSIEKHRKNIPFTWDIILGFWSCFDIVLEYISVQVPSNSSPEIISVKTEINIHVKLFLANKLLIQSCCQSTLGL